MIRREYPPALILATALAGTAAADAPPSLPCALPEVTRIVLHGNVSRPAGAALVLLAPGDAAPAKVLEWNERRIVFLAPRAAALAAGKPYALALRAGTTLTLLGTPPLAVPLCASGEEPAMKTQGGATDDDAAAVNLFLDPAASAATGTAPSPSAADHRLHVLPGGSATLRGTSPTAAFPVAPAAAAGAAHEQGEVLLLHASLDAARSADNLVRGIGGQLIRRRQLASLGLVISTYRLPAAAPLPAQLRRLTESSPDLLADVNHRYRLLGIDRDPRSQGFSAGQIGWPEREPCGAGRRIGLVDSLVDTTQPALQRARIHQTSVLPAGVDAAHADHGTAIAGLLVGDPAFARFGGLVPLAELFVADVFRRDGEGEDTTAEWVAAGLDWLAQQQVSVINLSFGGPPNRILAAALQRLQGLDIKLVAAAGNGGPDASAPYPAAWDAVIAVTAVDADRRVYDDANRGGYIDFAAPGVDVWAIGGEQGRFVSGTSYAAPFVTAALATGRTEDQLAADAIDLGEPGLDRVYGRGLIQLANLHCDAIGG